MSSLLTFRSLKRGRKSPMYLARFLLSCRDYACHEKRGWIEPTPTIYLIVMSRSSPSISSPLPLFVPSHRNRLSRYHPFVAWLYSFPLFCQLRDDGFKLRTLPLCKSVCFAETFSRDECSTTRNSRARRASIRTNAMLVSLSPKVTILWT